MTHNNASEAYGWNFDNSYAALSDSLFSLVSPTPVRSPGLVIFNDALAGELGLNAVVLRSDDGVAVLAGNRLPEGAESLAQAYAGHQFGHFTKLGDGRAILLGEQITPQGERFDIQLKGPGRTPYSRGGDGRATLGPMLREYIISEAIYALGIPTTRSLAVVTTGEPVFRETALPGAILTRVAASHLRVGTFQYVSNWGTAEELMQLVDYALARHYPEAVPGDNRPLTLLKEVIGRQAALIASWQLVGFIHGVMNTDNMTISGETIDYGPCAFMDVYDPATVFSSIDAQGRYAYGNQPRIGAWNLARLAEALLPVLHHDEAEAIKLAEEAIGGYSDLFYGNWIKGMRAKLGLYDEESEDEALIHDLLVIMKEAGADYTNTFRALTMGRLEPAALQASAEFAPWHERWQARLGRQQESADAARQLMQRSNPAVIPRNYRVEEALAAAVERSDYSVMERLLQALSSPYAYSEAQEEYAAPPEANSSPYQTFCGT
ncbi:YdiU family protein [Paenibacillaceae bacterium]|nr:YdiU family protein [Paenibacillaceae bacterium]